MNTVKRPSVQDEFKRNPELKEVDLQHLRDWSSKQPHYPRNIPDEDLIYFLHNNYYKLEPTKVAIENFYTCRTLVTEFFSNRDPLGSKELRSTMGAMCIIPLPKKTPEGYCVLYAKFINCDVEQFFFNDGICLLMMILDLWMVQHGTMKGLSLNLDLAGVTMSHALRISPIMVKKFLYYVQEANPVRLKAVHFMNTTPVVDFILGLMKPFMKKELLDKIHVHSTLDSLKKHMSIEIFPNESGGRAGPIIEMNYKVIKNLEDHRQYLLAEESEMRLNLALRPRKSTNDLFGIDGSFKKLDIELALRDISVCRALVAHRRGATFVLFTNQDIIEMNKIKRVSVEEEFKKNPELKEEDLQHLRDWIKKQPHYPKNISDSDLIIFLHSCYYRLEPTKTCMENYYASRTHVPEIFHNRDPIGCRDIKYTMETLHVVPLDQPTPEGYRVFYARLVNFEVERFIYYDGLKLFNMLLDLWLIENGTMKGHVLVCDIVGVQMSHVLRIPPVGVKKYLFYLQEAVPLRIKSLHFMNTTSVIDFILGLMKPFMKKEFMDMLYLHPTLDSIGKHFPVEILPDEAGGKGGSIYDLFSRVSKSIDENRDYFVEEEATMRIDESLRPGKAKNASDLFGIEGSFKKLDID
ncbi:uncharacterized protein LOC100118942 [Nasonia vitripennis]|uniref:CRAL-TRIO domain-containing protein n=1 Tax=Nasonia vitripennis TaxID=7425 RepID=A0A7M7QNE4_NASVI|nr:uncharacterized protein LOC100118942 [Nasonia vitripennis]